MTPSEADLTATSSSSTLLTDIRHRKDQNMNAQLERIRFNIELGRGEKLTLPPALIDSVGEGRWTITIQPADDMAASPRDHGAFLGSYSPDDEGLYDDCTSR